MKKGWTLAGRPVYLSGKHVALVSDAVLLAGFFIRQPGGGLDYFTSTLMELYQAAKSSMSPLVKGLAMMAMISFWRLPLR